jgi:hypothetical protein
VQKLEAVADRGYFNGEEILVCDRAAITVTLCPFLRRKLAILSKSKSMPPERTHGPPPRFHEEHIFCCDGRMLKVEVIVSVVDKPKACPASCP